jgi:hypothetical protein
MPGVVLAVTDHDPGTGHRTTTTVTAGVESDLGQDPAFLADTVRIVLEWARGRALGSSSVTGISVALALCAAAWLTAGSRSGNLWAALALTGSYLALLAGRSLAAGPASAGRRADLTGQPDALGKARYLGAIGWSVAECAVYAGLAIGAVADHWSAIWILAIAVLSLTGVREVMTASMWPAGRDDPDRGLLRRVIAEALRMPAGGRAALIIIVAPVWGSRAALLALLDWTIIAVGFGLASLQGPAREDRVAATADPAPASPREPQGLSVLLLPAAAPAEPRLDPADVDALEVPGDDAESDPGPGPENSPFPDEASEPAQAALPVPVSQPAEASPPPAGPPASDAELWQDRLILLRDDGMLARNLGALVRGNLLPLPPALLGLAATAVLAYLGLRSVPGILILSPCLIMLLAAFGSSNRHAGRLDWLVPAVLLGWQCLYLTTVGQAQGVPAPATFALCAVLLVRYADLASPGRAVIMAKRRRRNWTIELTEGDRERGGTLGWEGRMLLMGAAAAAGIGTLAYVALSAYLGWLICTKVLTSCLALREGDHR